MSIQVYDLTYDNVIQSNFVVASTTYSFAIDKLSHLIDKLAIQRRLLDSKIYQRLEADLKVGCIMPPITVAFVESRDLKGIDISEITDYVNRNIDQAFILDGIQRLSTLQRIEADIPDNIKQSGLIVLNILICPSMDNLLYRMITLNNGQKPMTPKHQIEILTVNDPLFESFEEKISTEREGYRKDSIGRADIVKAYLAFISNSTNIDNNKIIESKLEELIAEKIMESFEEKQIDFSSVINLIFSFIDSDDTAETLKWFRVSNNLIGFCVGVRDSFSSLDEESVEGFKDNLEKFDEVFKSFDSSKIKLGMYRRNAVKEFISNYETLKGKSVNEILDFVSSNI
ncbi:hypothetical protein F946_03160 [Acinetobacter johnsonii ANC 3681]|uniref:DUF262 domain-containing protein n=1 Tax=Acinetobacter johnsonii ANC 3681 TaxID=1217662 RepID=N9BDZ8_ACIJO|nr:hypothetical protein [Acinetobacter johnsonii]ENV71481.1 hypothetical protein F946_03160 [Acinetobacter johnsonii ANC 3681]